MNFKSLIIDSAGYFFTNRVHVFFMPAILTFFWSLDTGLALPLKYYLMITFTTAGGYIYNMYTDRLEDSVNYASRYRLWGDDPVLTKAIILFCFSVGFFLSLSAGWEFVLYGGVINFLGGVYSRPLHFGLGLPVVRVKEVLFLKNLYAGFFWSVVLVMTPYFYLGEIPGVEAPLIVLICLCMSFRAELMWDVRDIKGDVQAGVRTIPVVLGERTAFWLLRVVHFFICMLIFLGVKSGLLLSVKGWVVIGLYFPAGLLFLEWYSRLTDRMWASHVYIVMAGLIMLIGIVSQLTLNMEG